MSDAIPGPLAVVAHYNLLERLEPAGPGELFRARDTKLGRTVAVRLLPAGFTAPDAREEFIGNARGLAALSHPNVTTLFDVGEHEGRIYLVFEFFKGQSLRSEMGGRPINVRRALDLAVQMADAVADAHACGYVHGGLSPESVVITAKGRDSAFALASREGFASPTDARLHDYDSPRRGACRRTSVPIFIRWAQCCSRCLLGTRCIAAQRPVPPVPTSPNWTRWC
jgi:serine/threonine protein kinase